MAAKRTFDFICSLVLLVLLSPLLFLIACLVRLTSRGPVIFKERRVGYRKKAFTIFKFRTMRNGSHIDQTIALKGDSRVTFAGRLLRCAHLDELPQLWNVLRGEMSLVGPRPHQCWLALERRHIVAYHERFEVLPGITGLLQIKGRLDMLRAGPEKMASLDAFYVHHRSFLLDVQILLHTVRAVFTLKGV